MKNSCRYNMDRGWRFTEQKCSVFPNILSHENVYGFAKTGGAGGPASGSCDELGWETIDIPHDWQHGQELDKNAAADHGYHRGSVGWYRRQFLLDETDKNRAISLNFDGIGGKAKIYLNGVEVADNESRYNSFGVNITDVVNYGGVPNTLAIMVDSREWEGWWYEGSGIYRHAWLLKEPHIHISYNGIYIRSVKEDTSGRWNTYVELCFENDYSEPGECKVALEILDDTGKQVLLPIEDSIELDGFDKCIREYCFNLENVRLWNIDNPILYNLHVNMNVNGDIQDLEIPFGYRTIHVDPDTGFWLNGENVKLLGTCNHQDHACVGTAVSDTLVEYRLRKLKEMGCNAYRCAHHNPSPEVLDICDRLGILVMDENRMFNSSRLGMKLLEDMVKRDRNHPSVVMYSIFNEEPLQGTAKGRKIALHMCKVLKQWDNTRPVLGAFNGGIMEPQGASDVFDITGINYFVDSYDGFHETFPEQPVVASELVSAFSTRGAHQTNYEIQEFDNYDQNQAPWGESVREANQMVFSRPFVMGMFVWTGFDYHGEPSPYEWPSVSSHFGIMDMCGFPKDTYYLYQALWKNENVLHLFPHWNHTPGDIVTVMTYSNCEEVELFINGVSCGKKKNNIYDQCSWEVEYIPGEIEAVGYFKDGSIVRKVRHTSKELRTFRLESFNRVAYNDTKDAVILDIFAVDEDGIQVPLASNQIRVRVEGGELLGLGNGDPNCHISDQSEEYPLFYGKCQAILRAKEAEKLCVYVESQGILPVKYEWQIVKRDTESEVPAVNSIVVGNWKVFHQIWDSKPNPNIEISKSDMNTMESIEFDDMPLPQLKGKKNKYALYKTEVKLPLENREYQIRFAKCAGELEVYWNGKRIEKRNYPVAGEMIVSFSESCIKEGELIVIIKNTALDACAGIMKRVEIELV